MWDDELQQLLERLGRDRVEKAFARDPENRMYGDLDMYLDHWPIRHVQVGQPPFLFLIAEGEKEQPPVLKTNVQFVEKARELGNQADYRVLPDRTHMSAIRRFSETGDEAFSLVRDFILKRAETDRR